MGKDFKDGCRLGESFWPFPSPHPHPGPLPPSGRGDFPSSHPPLGSRFLGNDGVLVGVWWVSWVSSCR